MHRAQSMVNKSMTRPIPILNTKCTTYASNKLFAVTALISESDLKVDKYLG